jgi:hypothetical protein
VSEAENGGQIAMENALPYKCVCTTRMTKQEEEATDQVISLNTVCK